MYANQRENYTRVLGNTERKSNQFEGEDKYDCIIFYGSENAYVFGVYFPLNKPDIVSDEHWKYFNDNYNNADFRKKHEDFVFKSCSQREIDIVVRSSSRLGLSMVNQVFKELEIIMDENSQPMICVEGGPHHDFKDVVDDVFNNYHKRF